MRQNSVGCIIPTMYNIQQRRVSFSHPYMNIKKQIELIIIYMKS